MDTYRSPARTPEVGALVIGRRNVGSQWISIAIHASLIAAVVWAIVVWQWPVWLAVIGVVLGVSLLQDLHALTVPVEFALTRAGLHLRYSERTSGPRMRRIDRFIPWSEVQGIRTRELRSTGDITTTLHIETSSGTVTIESGTFDAPAERLQTQILDYMHSLGGAEQREQAGIPEFCRARWAEPLRLCTRRNPSQTFWAAVFVVVPPVVLMVLASWLWPVWLVLSSLFAWGIAAGLAAQRRVRVLELRADGLAVGSAPDKLETIAWHDILLVRRTIETSALRRATTALDVRLRDGRSIILSADYGRTLDELADLIDPPIATLALARSLMDAGMDIETAAHQAGLPDRQPAPQGTT